MFVGEQYISRKLQVWMCNGLSCKILSLCFSAQSYWYRNIIVEIAC